MADDISQMTDDELDKAIEGEEVVNEQSEDLPDETQEPTEEAPEQPVDSEESSDSDEAQVEETTEEEEQPKPSRRETLRVQQLLQKMKQEPSQPKPLEQPQGVNYRDTIEADEEVYKQLEAQSQAYGQQAYSEGLKKAEFLDWRTSLKIDAPQVESKYQFLNPKDKENFHPAVADSLNNWYLGMSGYDANTETVSNPQVGYGEFVEGVMELAEEIANAKVSRTKQNIAKQAATTGLRPDGSQAKRLNLNKAPEDMSDDELDAVLSQISTKR